MSSTPAFDIVVVGSINIDYQVRGPRLPVPGETVAGEEFLEGIGGKGANQAVAAARLGARVALVARVGRQFPGERLVGVLAAEGVDTRWIAKDDEAATGSAVIMVDAGGEKMIVTAPGANARLSPADVRAAADAIRTARVLLLQLEVRQPAIDEAIAIAHAAGVTVVMDPAPARVLSREVLRMIDVIRPNASEAEMLTGVRVTDRASAGRAAEMLRGWGVRSVAVQAAGEGNLLVWEGGEVFVPLVEVPVVDATGAGDAFAAGLSVGLADGMEFVEAGRFASAAAAIATTRLGAQSALPRRREVLDLLDATPAR